MRTCACPVPFRSNFGSGGPRGVKRTRKGLEASMYCRGSRPREAVPFRGVQDDSSIREGSPRGQPEGAGLAGERRNGILASGSSFGHRRLLAGFPPQWPRVRQRCKRRPRTGRYSPRLQWRDRRGFSPRSTIPRSSKLGCQKPDRRSSRVSGENPRSSRALVRDGP